MTAHLAPPAADRPAHYRLGDETWALILKEYREGATAPFLARKWRVSEHAVRRRVTRHGATKREWGDAQAVGQALAREAELEEARRNSPEAVAARLFDGVEGEAEGEWSGDPGLLARQATWASGRAMRGRLWAEARALAGLAESYARLAQGRGAGGGSVDGGAAREKTYTLADVKRALLDEQFASQLMSIDPDDPVKNPVKIAYWTELREINRRMDGVNFAFRRFVEATGGQGVEYTREGMAAARAEAARYKLWRETIDAGAGGDLTPRAGR